MDELELKLGEKVWATNNSSKPTCKVVLRVNTKTLRRIESDPGFNIETDLLKST
jgi:hypothetical protein